MFSVLAAAVVVPLSAQADAAGPQLSRLNLTANGARVYLTESSEVAISGNGRYVAAAVSLTDPGKRPRTTVTLQVVLHDRKTGFTKLVTSSGAKPRALPSAVVPEATGARWLSISRDGRYLVFTTDAADLVPGDLNDSDDVYLFDRVTGRASLVVQDPSGQSFDEGSSRGAISADGSTVVFHSGAPVVSGIPRLPAQLGDYFVHRGTRRYRYVYSDAGMATSAWITDAGSPPPGWRMNVSANGRYIAFLCHCAADGGPWVQDDSDKVNVLRRDTRAARSADVGITLVTEGDPDRSKFDPVFDMDDTGKVFVLTTGKSGAYDGGTFIPVLGEINAAAAAKPKQISYVLRDLASKRDTPIPTVPEWTGSSAMFSLYGFGYKSYVAPPVISGNGRVAAYVARGVTRAGMEPELVANELYRWESASGAVRRERVESLATACENSDLVVGAFRMPCPQGVLAAQPALTDSGDEVAFATYDRLLSSDTDNYADVYVAT